MEKRVNSSQTKQDLNQRARYGSCANWRLLKGAGGPQSQEALVQGGNQCSHHEVLLEMHDGKVKAATADAETQEIMWWVVIRAHSSLLWLMNLQC